MRCGLFVPCYIDQFYPSVAVATLQFLQSQGVSIEYPEAQTCCGQPMANSGCEMDSKEVYRHFVKTFSDYDYIVTPSGSCAYHVRKHFDIIEQTEEVLSVRSKIYELVTFMDEILGIKAIDGWFPFKIGVHVSCHGQRGLKALSSTEVSPVIQGPLLNLIQSIRGIEVIKLNRQDECCGFGGTFCVNEYAVSGRMGIDRVQDHFINGVEVLTGSDMSCLMQLDSIIKRQKLHIKVFHIAEILNSITK